MMASPTESTYGDIQMNERYKRLRRNLKMTLMKEAEQRNTDNGINDNAAWPNVSSINGDNLDTSSAAISLCSKNGSEVVSSSTNMRNVLSHQNHKKFLNLDNNVNNNKDTIATSSVKQFPLTNDAATKLMPPPKSIGILAHSSRRNSPANRTTPQMNMRLGNTGMSNDYGISSSSVYSSKCPSSENAQDTSQVVFEKEMLHDEMRSSFAVSEKPDRVFSKWRVMLNDKGQLIIKGTLECGKVARSKPVIRRLTAISVQSIFNHIYNLSGNIYDERNELPDYIRGKFFNGFPDDWENVYQVWRNYIAGGSSLNFRWPTPITDSDDDLKSEITEIHSPQKIARRSRLRSESFNDRNHSKYSPQLFKATDRTITTEEALNCSQCQCSVANSVRNESTNSSKNISKIVNDECSSNIDTSSVKRMQNLQLNTVNTNFTPSRPSINITSLKDVLPEDKINIILENLNSKNCSIEYIDKIFQMYDCFRYIMSYKSEAETGAESIKSMNISLDRRQPENGNISHVNSDATFTKSRDTRTNISHSSADRDRENENPNNNSKDISKKMTNMTNGSTRKQRVRKRLSKNYYDSSDSYENDENDSDFNRMNKSGRRILRSYRQRSGYRRTSITDRKLSRRHKEKSDDSDGDDYVPAILNLPSIPAGSGSHDQVGSIVHKMPQKNRRNVAVNKRPTPHQQPTANLRQNRASSMSTIGGFLKNYDSSVSITEDENKIRIDKYTNLKPNNNSEGNDVRRQLQSNLRNSHPYYDSSVSITEDEFAEANRDKHDMRKQVLQEDNAQSLQQVIKKSTVESKNSPYTSRFSDQKTLPRALSKISEIDEVSRRESFFKDHENEEIILDNNKENQSVDAGENRNEKSQTNSRESELNGQTIAVQLLSNSISPERRKKLTIAKIENISVNMGPKSKTKPQPQKLDSSNNCSNELPALEYLRPSKSLDDRKRAENSADEFSSVADQLKAIPKSKSLTIKLHDIIDTAKGNQSVESKGEKIDKEKGVFGSQDNPKRLTAWVPKVLQKSGTDYGLIFEGKLLNEADHVVNRKFSTDFISTRITLKTVKTASNEFYQLVGDLTDTKHTMPKELQKLCLNGCPAKIAQFCEKWRKLVLDNSNSSGQLNISKDMQNMPVSSRGRRILPPLCYWKGERVTMRDNQVVYSPGNSQDSSLLSTEISQRDDTSNSFKRKDTSAKDTTVSTKKNSSIDIENREKISNIIEAKKQKDAIPNILQKRTSNHELRMRRTRNTRDSKTPSRDHQSSSTKRTLSRKLSPHSSDSMNSDNEASKPKRRRAKIDNSMTNLDNENKKPRTQRGKELKKSNVHPIEIEVGKNRKYTSPRRQRNKTEKNGVANTCGMITYKYEKRINRESELSEDQISNI